MYVDIFNTTQHYDLILADPPWEQFKTVRKNRPHQIKNFNYPICSLDEIKTHLQTADSLTPP